MDVNAQLAKWAILLMANNVAKVVIYYNGLDSDDGIVDIWMCDAESNRLDFPPPELLAYEMWAAVMLKPITPYGQMGCITWNIRENSITNDQAWYEYE